MVGMLYCESGFRSMEAPLALSKGSTTKGRSSYKRSPAISLCSHCSCTVPHMRDQDTCNQSPASQHAASWSPPSHIHFCTPSASQAEDSRKASTESAATSPDVYLGARAPQRVPTSVPYTSSCVCFGFRRPQRHVSTQGLAQDTRCPRFVTMLSHNHTKLVAHSVVALRPRKQN